MRKRIGSVLCCFMLLVGVGCSDDPYEEYSKSSWSVESAATYKRYTEDETFSYLIGNYTSSPLNAPGASEAGLTSTRYYANFVLDYNVYTSKNKDLDAQFETYLYKSEVLKFEIDIYDIHTQEKYKTIDAKKIMEESIDMENYQYSHGNNYLWMGVDAQGKEYVAFNISKIPSDEMMDINTANDENDGQINQWYQDANYTFYINIEDESGRLEQQKEYSLGFVGRPLLGPLYGSNISLVNTEDEIRSWVWQCNPYWEDENKDTIWVILRSDTLLKEEMSNIELFKKYPKLKERLEKMNMDLNKEEELSVVILLKDYTWEEALKLFMEEGKEISYEGVYMDLGYSKDMKEYEIHSEEEYYQYLGEHRTYLNE